MKDQKNLDIQKSNDEKTETISETINQDDSSQEEIKELDPTHFGDWQIGCKTIDF